MKNLIPPSAVHAAACAPGGTTFARDSCCSPTLVPSVLSRSNRWAEAPIKIARMTLTIKLDGNWSSFQLANSAPPLSVTDSAIAPSARMPRCVRIRLHRRCNHASQCCWMSYVNYPTPECLHLVCSFGCEKRIFQSLVAIRHCYQ